MNRDRLKYSFKLPVPTVLNYYLTVLREKNACKQLGHFFKLRFRVAYGLIIKG